MTAKKRDMDNMDVERADEILQQLIRLKRYETPASDRMTRNQQNIMRRVRQEKSRRWSLSDLLEVNIPWFFAEPRYGIAMLFVVFAGLQFWGAKVNHGAQEQAGLFYPTSRQVAVVEQPASLISTSTNKFNYPDLPAGMKFFPDRSGNGGTVKFVGLEQ